MAVANVEKRSADWVKPAVSIVKVIAIVAGVVISVLSFDASRRDEAAARSLEAKKAFLELRQTTYLEIVRVAAILSTPSEHSADESKTARKRFAELYVAELSLVESEDVEGAMIALAKEVAPDLTTLTPPQDAAYKLAHALRNSLVQSWNIRPGVVANPNN